MVDVTISAVAALGNQRQIGKDNELLWNIPEDLKRFKQLTTGKAVIMGRKTWESLPKTVRPLPGRKNIILTRDKTYKAPGGIVKHDTGDATRYAKKWSKEQGEDEFFIIGGEVIYSTLLSKTDRLYLTLVNSDVDGDVFFPDYRGIFKEVERKDFPADDNHPAFSFLTLERV